MKSQLFLSSLLALGLLAGCGQNESKTPITEGTQAPAAGAASAPMMTAAPAADGGITGRILETMDTAGYTYAKLDTGNGEVWVAGPETPLKVGDEVTAVNGMSMGKYHSQTLNRDFDELYFVSAFSGGDAAAAAMTMGAEMPAGGDVMMPAEHPPRETPEMVSVHLDPAAAAGAVRIGDLFNSAQTFKGQIVTVQGQVVKFNRAIMDRNWVHLQDGSGDPAKGTHDLTVTTADTVKVGDVVTMAGMVALDQDFGAGYSYDLLVENATVVHN